MTRRTRFLALLALAPAAALAQAGALDAARGAAKTAADGNVRVQKAADAAAAPDAAGPATDVEVGDGMDLSAAPVEGGAPSADQGQGTVPPPDTYTVRPGDTLWDLSGRFLNNPWYWPKIWSYNPEIANPHWIAPGNTLKFFPSAEEAPTRVEPVDSPVADAASPLQDVEEEDAAPAPLEDVSKADINAPAKLDQDIVSYGGTRKPGYVAPRGNLMRHDTFVTPRELEESGAIKAAFDEKLMLTTLDRAYASFKGAAPVRVGETYVIYRTERPIHHPTTKELIGYQSVILGAARVVAVDDKAATLVITAASDAIERGAMLGPWVDKIVRPMVRKPNAASLEGLIVGAPVEILTQLAQHQVVFIDKGTADGVEEGNVLQVVRSGDLSNLRPSTPPSDATLPKEDVGDLFVIDAREKTSAALVTRSIGELFIGDRVEMRAAEGVRPKAVPAAAPSAEPASAPAKKGGGLFDDDEEDEKPAKG